jgi:hypothetical protein
VFGILNDRGISFEEDIRLRPPAFKLGHARRTAALREVRHLLPITTMATYENTPAFSRTEVRNVKKNRKRLSFPSSDRCARVSDKIIKAELKKNSG